MKEDEDNEEKKEESDTVDESDQGPDSGEVETNETRVQQVVGAIETVGHSLGK